MRIVVLTEPWPEGESNVVPARAAADLVAHSWQRAAEHTTVTAVPVGCPDPRCADAIPGRRVNLGGAEAIDTERGLLLVPPAGAVRWNPHDLLAALLVLAAEAVDAPQRLPVIIPVGDEPPAGDATDLWGASLSAMRRMLEPLALTVLTASQRPLLGFRGMAAATMRGRESDVAIARAAQEQERRWAVIAARADEEVPRTMLLGPSRLADAPATGAAGGLAYCLAALGAHLTQAAPFVADLAGLRRVADGADVLVLVTAVLDPNALDNGLSAPVAAEAARRGIPFVVVAPEVEVGKRDLMAAGVSSAYAAGPGPDALAIQVERIAHTWTPAAR